MEDYKKTKDKLFAKAMEAGKKGFENENNSGIFTPNPGNTNQPPLNINLDINPETDYKNIGIDYTKGNFNVGANYQPGFSTTQPGFFPGQTIEVENPSNYNVRAGYKNKNFGFNVNVGSGNNYGASMNFNRQF
tara:strand:+ start:174 stop:572 length:399 start_codon:yes stop_codon:yes gene_type:complete